MGRFNNKSFRFYQGLHHTLRITGDRHQVIFRNEHQPLALIVEQVSILLASDKQDTVHTTADRHCQSSYSPYGYGSPARVDSALAYNGEWWEQPIDGYLLGNGYRAYSPILMRFQSPDSLSPFGEGGLNGYGYCKGEPINNSDPSGHMLGPSTLPLVNQTAGKYGAMGTTEIIPAAANRHVKQDIKVSPKQHRMDSPNYTPAMAIFDANKIKVQKQINEAIKQNDPAMVKKLTTDYLQLSIKQEQLVAMPTVLSTTQISTPVSHPTSAGHLLSVESNNNIRNT
jgi:RHS repeat-associated protein